MIVYVLRCCFNILCLFFFFFNDTATTEIYTLSLHDALPIYMLGKIIGLIEESIKLFFFIIHSDVTDSLDKAEVALQNYETRKAQNAPEATLTELSRALRNSQIGRAHV